MKLYGLAFRAIAILFVFVTAVHADFTTLPAALAKDLASPDMKARVRARQLLPRHGVAAVDHLLPLLASEDQGVKLTAYNVLADIANAAAAPGREAERDTVARKLLTLLEPGQPDPVLYQGLRLLPIVAPQGFDFVQPIQPILVGTDTRAAEKARECLTLMATDSACDTMAPAMITCVPEMKNSRPTDESLPAIREITSNTATSTSGISRPSVQ